jgi:hypothetical protein
MSDDSAAAQKPVRIFIGKEDIIPRDSAVYDLRLTSSSHVHELTKPLKRNYKFAT